MDKNEYLKLTRANIHNKDSKQLLINQINNFYEVVEKYKNKQHNYKVWDLVKLKKWTLLHWTYKNIEWLKLIAKIWLITGQFESWRSLKYLYTVGVRNLKKNYLLKDYINFYSGWTIKYWNMNFSEYKTQVIPFDKMNNIIDNIKKNRNIRWYMEQTKEARFMPSLVQDEVQIWIIFDWNNLQSKKLVKMDILNSNAINDKDVKPFVNHGIYKEFLNERKNKDDFFTDRESAILFWLPANLIEWILVWRVYEKNKKILKNIKELLPNVYICNLDGKIILA